MSIFDSIKTGYLTDDEFIKIGKELDDFTFKSGLKIFADHRGFRPGEIHTFIGTKGSGKSTWAKTLISELVYDSKNVLLYISEENRDKYMKSVNGMFRRHTQKAPDVKKYLDQIFVISEMELQIDDVEVFFNTIEELIEKVGLDILIMDNFTTAFLAEEHISQQPKILKRFKQVAIKYNIPVILFFHTSKNYDPKTLDGDSVRGSAAAVNIGSYNYVIYQYKGSGRIKNFIYTEKARYHNKANKVLYEVLYNYDIGIFTKSEVITMEDFKEQTRDRKW